MCVAVAAVSEVAVASSAPAAAAAACAARCLKNTIAPPASNTPRTITTMPMTMIFFFGRPAGAASAAGSAITADIESPLRPGERFAQAAPAAASLSFVGNYENRPLAGSGDKRGFSPPDGERRQA